MLETKAAAATANFVFTEKISPEAGRLWPEGPVLSRALSEGKQNVRAAVRSATQGFLGDGLGYGCHRSASEPLEEFALALLEALL